MNVMFPICNDAIKLACETKSFACFYSNTPPPGNSIHMHDCHEILFCIKGSGKVFADDKTYSLESGNVYVTNQFEAHMFLPDDPNDFERYILEIDPAFLYTTSTENTDLGTCFSIRNQDISHKIELSDKYVSKLTELFQNLAKDYEFGDDVLKTISATAIITIVNDLFEKQSKSSLYQSSLENKTVDTAVKYINKNYSAQLNLELVAKNSFVSVKELCRLFKKHLGTTVSKYIMSKRISEAKKLLKNGAGVQTTSEKCGFSDYTSFIRAFNRTVGMSPGKYKKNT